MVGRFTGSNRTVVTGTTISNHLRMINACCRGPGQCRVAAFTGVGGTDVIHGLTSANSSVVAGTAGAQYLIVINDHWWRPGSRGVTALAGV